MAAPTNFRVEAVANGTVRIRWTTSGTVNLGIYRSTDGSSYSLLATTLMANEEYYDTGLTEQTRYWYKGSDDVGVTFTSAVDVTTYVETLGGGRVNSTPLALVSPDEQSQYQELAQQIQALENKNTLAKTPCDICLVNGAIVLDCSKGCNWFRVIMDGDINSITVIGCEECPPCDFIIPPGEEHSICGWPLGCEYTWDECFDAPLTGGLGGRTAKTNGLSYGGYGVPGGGAKPDTQCCECPAVDRVGAGDYLRIACCETDGDCSMECGESFRIKACGGLAPYTWSKTGTVSLSSTSGACITVTSTETASGSGWGSGPAGAAWLHNPKIQIHQYDTNNGPCTGGNFTTFSAGNIVLGTVYDCAGNIVASGTSCPSGMEMTIDATPSCTGCNDPDDDAPNCGGWTLSCGPRDGSSIEITLTCTPQNSAGSSYSGIATVAPIAFPGIQATFDNAGPIDIRSQAMVDAGTCVFGGGGGSCTQDSTTVTVTDKAGVSATVILA